MKCPRIGVWGLQFSIEGGGSCRELGSIGRGRGVGEGKGGVEGGELLCFRFPFACYPYFSGWMGWWQVGGLMNWNTG